MNVFIGARNKLFDVESTAHGDSTVAKRVDPRSLSTRRLIALNPIVVRYQLRGKGWSASRFTHPRELLFQSVSHSRINFQRFQRILEMTTTVLSRPAHAFATTQPAVVNRSFFFSHAS